MTDVSPDQLATAIEGQHGGKATFVEVVPVKETFQGQTVWEGWVHVFDLDGHPKATRAYAWSSPIEGSEKRRFYAVLHLGPIRSAQDAVRAAIVADARAKKVPDRIPNADDFRMVLRSRFADTAQRGGSYLDVNSGELGRAVGAYPQPNRMPNLCRVMRDEMRGRDAIISDTRDGYDGPRLTIRYYLPR